MRLTVAYDFLPRRLTPHCRRVMRHFGIDQEQGRCVVADVDLPLLRPGSVVYFTGPSGSGKSSLLREAVRGLLEEGQCIERIDLLRLPGRPLVDALQLPFRRGLELLSACGLGEAQILLRTPMELSDGQRHRFRLALGLARLECSRNPKWLAADEFTATLDRTLAKVIAFNARRLADRTGVGFLLAGCHEDVIGDLDPDVLLRCDLGGQASIEMAHRREPENAEKSSQNDLHSSEQ